VVEKTVTVMNHDGIHCRPSSMILMAAQEYPDCEFMVNTQKGNSDLSSILSLLGMGLDKGDEVTVRAEGPDAGSACERIADLFAYEFDFPKDE